MENKNFKLEDLIDTTLFQDLQEKLNSVYSFPSAIIDNEGKILSAVAWQDICTKFHRKHPECEKECIKSDQYILKHLSEANPAVSYQCPHGLVDNATPIIVDNQHLGNFFTGQFFLEKPDIDFFRNQARKYSFDEAEYLEAVTKVPIWTKEKVAIYLDFIKGFIQIIASIALKNLKEKEINEELLKSEERFRLVVENSADMITLHDSEGKYLYYTGPQKYGIKPSDVIGKTPHDFFEKDIADQITDQIKTTYLTGEHKKIEIYINWLGKMTWFEENIYPIKNDNTIISVVKICSDISDRKYKEIELLQAKEKAEENEMKFKTAFYTSPDAVNFNKLNGEYVDINEGFTRLTGYTKEDVIGKLSSEIDIWHFPEDRKKLVNTLLEKGIVENLESLFKAKDGTLIPALMSARIIELNHTPHILSVTREITERKKYEKEMMLAKEKAEESDRLKTAFLQNMSHEIRTPMNAIMGFSQLLMRNYGNKAKLQDSVNIINQRCDDLLVILDDILDISKIESGQLPVFNESFNINSLFAELRMFFIEHQQKIGKQHINFILQAQCDPTHLTITTDKVKLKQILINLIGNAFKFTDNGKIEGGCHLDESNNIIFYVSDTGIGIPAEKLESIFERFVQLKPAPNRLFGGTGLGLSIVKGLVNLLGGKLWLKSEPNVGTTFYFSLPYNSQQEIQNEQVLDNLPNIEPNFQHKTILVVEDDNYNAAFINEVLSEIQIKTILVQYGKDAVDKAIAEPIDLVLMDIGLPDISGYEAIRQIKQQKPELKIIAQTAYAAQDDKSKALSAGCINYISKPLNTNKLLSLISKHLS